MSFSRHFFKKHYRNWLDSLPDELAVQIMYFRTFKKFMNLKSPKTFNEKLIWRKIHQRDPRFTVFADKIAVKDEISRLIGQEHIIPTLWSGQNPEEIPFDQLAPPYAIKVSHSSGLNIFVKTAKDLDSVATISSMKKQLLYSHHHLFREWSYLGIPRRVLVEKMLIAENGQPPVDYKFYVFHGEVKIIQIDTDRFDDHYQLYLDKNWETLPFRKDCKPMDGPPPKPARLDKLLELAVAIGSQFDFVRVDLYDTPEGIFFGETTFYPGAGDGRFQPEKWDGIIGSYWNTHDQIPS